MKLLCRCEHIIRDQTDDLPYKAFVRRDKLEEQMYSALTQDLVALLDAHKTGRSDEWFQQEFGVDTHKGLPLEERVSDLLLRRLTSRSLGLLQCERCGRLWLQNRRAGTQYLSFVPEDEVGRVLDVEDDEAVW